MELFIFGRFHVRQGKENEFAKALREVVRASRGEVGCIEIHGYSSIRDARLFYVHSRWKDGEAFELHARLPHTVKFLATAERLSEHPVNVTRAERIG